MCYIRALDCVLVCGTPCTIYIHCTKENLLRCVCAGLTHYTFVSWFVGHVVHSLCIHCTNVHLLHRVCASLWDTLHIQVLTFVSCSVGHLVHLQCVSLNWVVRLSWVLFKSTINYYSLPHNSRCGHIDTMCCWLWTHRYIYVLLIVHRADIELWGFS